MREYSKIICFVFCRQIIAVFLLSVIFEFYVEGLVKIDAANVIVGGNVNYTQTAAVRPTVTQDVVNAGVDIADLRAVLNGINLPLALAAPAGAANSWLNLPRTINGRVENLETHLLRGHGPAGGISQSHIMTNSQFSGAVIAGIPAPLGGLGLAIDPTMPTVAGPVFGGLGMPVDQNWNQLQRNVNNVNVPIKATVADIVNAINAGNQVVFQVAPIGGMRKFIIDLNQANLVNCSRPIIYDDQTPLPIVVPPLSEAWLRKQGGANPWKVSQRPSFLMINLPSRSQMQINEVLIALGSGIVFPAANPMLLQQQAVAAVPAAMPVDAFGREMQRIPMTIYYSVR